MAKQWLAVGAVVVAAACSALVDLPATTDTVATSATTSIGGGSIGGAATASTSQGGGGVGGSGGNVMPTGDHLWSRRFGGTSLEDASHVTVDQSGNVFVVGIFQGTVDFGGGPFEAGDVHHAFVLKLNPQGDHVWSRHFGGTSGFTSAAGLAVSSTGELFVCGAFTGSVQFGNISMTSDQNADGYVLRLDALGNVLSAQHFSGVGVQTAQSIGLDAAGNVVVAGNFSDSIDVDGDVLSSSLQASYVVKHTAAGDWMWSAVFQGPQMYVFDMATASDGVVLAGYFAEYADVAGGSLLGNGSWDALVAKISDAGVHLWSLNAGNDQLQLGYGVAVSASDAPAVTGYFLGSIDFGGGPLTSTGNYDAFAVQLASGGGHVWTKTLGNPNYQEGHGIAIDSSDSVVHVGLFQGTIAVGNRALPSAGEADAFVVKRDATGEPLWGKSFGSTGVDDAVAAAIGPDDTVIVAGTFIGTVDFGGGPLSSDGSERDMFVVKLAP